MTRTFLPALVLAAVLLPGDAHSQASPAVRVPPARRAILADSIQRASERRVGTIPNVIGLKIGAAIDSIARTRLTVIQRQLETREQARETVVDQAPKGGSPIGRARAETLWVAATPIPATRARSNWIDKAKGIVSRLDSPTPKSPPPVDATVKPGKVVSTRVPTPAREVTTVPGIVVQGRTRVPDLLRKTAPMVRAALEESQLRVGTIRQEFSDEIDSGRVFRQHPQKETQVATSAKVDIWYSLGPHPLPQTLTVPSVLGLTLGEATDSLERVGLRAGYVQHLVEHGATSRVVNQTPHQGQPVHRSDQIDLTISDPPKSVEVPRVLGKTRVVAKQLLEAVGLGVGSVKLTAIPNTDSVVVDQLPAPLATADSGGLVDLTINRPPELGRVRVPNLVGKSLAEATRAVLADSLVLGDTVRPANALDRIVAQNPNAQDLAFVHSAITVALADATGSTEPVGRIPLVIGKSADVARRLLADSGFNNLSIRPRARDDSVTSSSLVDSQQPDAGVFAVLTSSVLLVAESPLRPLPVPNLVGMTTANASKAAEIDYLKMIVSEKVRRVRLDDVVILQTPRAQSVRPADGTISVTVAVPVVPPFAAAIFGLVLTAGGAGVGTRRWFRRNKKTVGGETKPPPDPDPRLDVPEVVLRPSLGNIDPPTIHTDGRQNLIRSAITLRFGLDSVRCEPVVAGDTIIRRENLTHATE